MKRFPYVSVILENTEGEVLLLLREDRSTTVYPNHWTLIGGNVHNDEAPQAAAARLLQEETGLVEIPLSFWKQYDREHALFMIDQYVYTGKVEDSGNMLVLGRDMQFFNPCEIAHLRIGYGFKDLLQEYLLIKDR